MICAVGSVFAMPRMILKLPLSTNMPSLLARSSMGCGAAVAKRDTPTARPTDAHAMASKEILDGDMAMFLFQPKANLSMGSDELALRAGTLWTATTLLSCLVP